MAADGSWRVDIPGGALGGTADVSIVQTAEGVFQCALPSATNPANPACVRVAEVNKRLPDRYDPKVQRLFRQWLPVFTDRQAALSVVPARPLPGAESSPVPGQCYSVDGISASLKAPVDVGIYCYADNGLLTAHWRMGDGTELRLTANLSDHEIAFSVSAGTAMIEPPPPSTAIDRPIISARNRAAGVIPAILRA